MFETEPHFHRQGGLSADITALTLTLLALSVWVVHATTIELTVDVELILAKCAVLAEAVPCDTIYEPYSMLNECGDNYEASRVTTTRWTWWWWWGACGDNNKAHVAIMMTRWMQQWWQGACSNNNKVHMAMTIRQMQWHWWGTHGDSNEAHRVVPMRCIATMMLLWPSLRYQQCSPWPPCSDSFNFLSLALTSIKPCWFPAMKPCRVQGWPRVK